VKPASRMERIGTETAFEAAARARALEATGRDVIHLEIGEPDFDTPRNIREAASEALLAAGGTITHHHAVGRDHRPGYDRQRPDLFATALHAAKGALDPAGVLIP